MDEAIARLAKPFAIALVKRPARPGAMVVPVHEQQGEEFQALGLVVQGKAGAGRCAQCRGEFVDDTGETGIHAELGRERRRPSARPFTVSLASPDDAPPDDAFAIFRYGDSLMFVSAIQQIVFLAHGLRRRGLSRRGGLVRRALQTNERGNLGAHFIQLFGRCLPLGGCFARFPIEVFHLIGQYRAADAFRLDDDFKGIAFDLGGHRATQHGAGFAVVGGGTEYQCRAMPGLFVPDLRREF